MTLEELLPRVQKNIPLSSHTSLRVGGVADYFFEAHTREDIIEALSAAMSTNTPYIILGGGTNVLVSDKGFRGLVIRIRTTGITEKENSLVIDAGVPMGVLVAYAAKQSLSGLEWAGGLPGTVGGAIRGNAGTFGKTLADALISVDVFDPDTKSEKTYNKEDIFFDYRESSFKRSGEVILSAEIMLGPGSKEDIMAHTRESILYRAEHHPSYDASSGCFFKNVDPQGKTFEIRGKMWFDRIPTGYLVDEAGLKGYQVGGAKVSNEHGNFIVNTGSATADDLVILLSLVKDRIKNTYGVLLKEEIELLGFY